jgi:hypothetical protein
VDDIAPSRFTLKIISPFECDPFLPQIVIRNIFEKCYCLGISASMIEHLATHYAQQVRFRCTQLTGPDNKGFSGARFNLHCIIGQLHKTVTVLLCFGNPNIVVQSLGKLASCVLRLASSLVLLSRASSPSPSSLSPSAWKRFTTKPRPRSGWSAGVEAEYLLARSLVTIMI